MGIWIVGKENMSQLTHYVPADMNWEWSTDSAMLWFVYSDPDRGGYSLIVEPGNPIEVDEGEYGSPLDPTFYFPTFSPIEKKVFSTANPFEQSGDADELFILNITESLTQAISTKVIPGILSVDWNEATQSILIQIVNRNDEEIESVEIQNQDGEVRVTIPQSMLYSITPGLTKELVPFYRFSLPGEYALSSSGRFLAVIRNPGRILLFECGVQK